MILMKMAWLTQTSSTTLLTSSTSCVLASVHTFLWIIWQTILLPIFKINCFLSTLLQLCLTEAVVSSINLLLCLHLRRRPSIELSISKPHTTLFNAFNCFALVLVALKLLPHSRITLKKSFDIVNSTQDLKSYLTTAAESVVFGNNAVSFQMSGSHIYLTLLAKTLLLILLKHHLQLRLQAPLMLPPHCINHPSITAVHQGLDSALSTLEHFVQSVKMTSALSVGGLD